MARNSEPSQWIVPTRGAKTLPAVEILTGRGFLTGKSGSGKSNTASVIAEELLENSYNMLIVDTEGEYYGLKEQYELLHVGNDEEVCDVQVGPDHAEKLATIAIEKNVPIILDVSDYLDGDEAQELIANVVRELYHKEKDARKPFLLVIEEMQEYLPQKGGSNDLADLLERVAKRGRKRGLGMLGISQRPSSVDKDFITQCDWMVWHRLTWKNDIDVVRNILGSDVADDIEDLDTGEAYLMTDWDDGVDRVQFKKKRTHDAGATPGLESYERPDLKTVSSTLVDEIKGSTAGQRAIDDADAAAGVDAPDGEAAEQAEDFAVDEVVDGVAALDPDGSTQGAPAGGADAAGGPGAGADLESMDRDELLEAAQALRTRNRVLEDEVGELRSVLQATDQRPEQFAADLPANADGGSEPPVPTDRSAPAAPTPARPQPPRRPPDRTGLSGNLVEFTEMVVFVGRAISYRLRLLSYKLRTRGANEGPRN